MEQFSSKTVQEVVEWLKAENFSSQVIQAFEGKAIFCSHILLWIENTVGL